MIMETESLWYFDSERFVIILRAEFILGEYMAI